MILSRMTYSHDAIRRKGLSDDPAGLIFIVLLSTLSSLNTTVLRHYRTYAVRLKSLYLLVEIACRTGFKTRHKEGCEG